MSQKKVVGSFNTEQEAISAIEDLKRQGHSSEDISVLSKDKQETETVAGETNANFVEGAATGATAGGALGGLGGVLAGMGALAIPGIGPLVAAGPIAAGLMGAAAGAGAGGLAGALIGMGIPDDEAEEYGRHVDEGRILVLLEERGRSIGDQIGREESQVGRGNTDGSGFFGERDKDNRDSGLVDKDDIHKTGHGLYVDNDQNDREAGLRDESGGDTTGSGLFGGSDRDKKESAFHDENYREDEGTGLFRGNDRDSTGTDAILENDHHERRDTSLGSDTDAIRKRGQAGL